MLWLLVACGPDPEVARLSAQVAELQARVDALEARPVLPDVDAVLEQVNGLIGASAELVPSEDTSPVPLPLSLLDDPATLESCRVLLHRGPDGDYDGYRLSAIRLGSVPDLAGLKNGDIVTAVQGRPLTSMVEAKAALEAVKAERPSSIAVALQRRGTPMTLTIPVAPEGTPDASAAERAAHREEIRKRLEERRAAREAGAAPPSPGPE